MVCSITCLFVVLHLTFTLGRVVNGVLSLLMAELKVRTILCNDHSAPKPNTRLVNHRAELKKAGDKRDEVYARLEAEYMNLQNPVRTANKFGIEEIIDPAKTRPLLCRWTKYM